ncbi:MAG TPA: PIN domain-containing protein [Bacteroidia bacterium]|nr:PIN domain-containing protein [Bacteroidia bacterium]
MTVTVDINVLLDVFQQRQPHYAASARIVSLVSSGKLVGICPAHGLTTLYYLVRKHSVKVDAERAMDRVLRHFQIGNLDASDWRQARQLPMDDFEDAAVAVVAETTGSAFVVTRNVADFAASPVSAITPADFLSRYTAAP